MTGKSKKTILWATFALLILGLFFVYFSTRTNEKPIETKIGSVLPCVGCNVVLISVDSLRSDHMSAYGYFRDTTPNFNKFTKNGALFLNYFSTSFLTPVSEAAVQTGMYPTSSGVSNFDTLLSPKFQTLTQYLKDSGYKTSALLSSPEFQVNVALKESFSRGFDKYQFLNFNDNNVTAAREYPTMQVINSEIDGFSGNKFFLWLAIGGAHWPYGANAKNVYVDPNYNGQLKGKVLDWMVFQNIYNGIVYPGRNKLLPADTQYIIDQYDNGVKGFDDFFGLVAAELKSRNLLENTIIVVESEHGEDLGEHGYFDHYDVTDTQTHTPLFIYIPAIKKEQKVVSFSSSIDVLPTVLELLGKTIPQNIQGKSLLPILTGKEKDGQRQQVFLERNPLFEEAFLQVRVPLEKRGIKIISGIYKDIAIRTPDWKYISRLAANRLSQISWWQSLTGQTLKFPPAELYDLKNDPGETKNVISENPDVANSLKAKLDEWYTHIASDSAKVEEKGELQPYF